MTSLGLTGTQVDLTPESMLCLTWVWELGKEQSGWCDFPASSDRALVTVLSPEAITLQEAEPIRMLQIDVSCPQAYRA